MCEASQGLCTQLTDFGQITPLSHNEIGEAVPTGIRCGRLCCSLRWFVSAVLMPGFGDSGQFATLGGDGGGRDGGVRCTPRGQGDDCADGGVFRGKEAPVLSQSFARVVHVEHDKGNE